ncbi:hypothetical protein GQ367_01435 [Polynucleobacter sp. MWH-CaK5]|uniref:hypothetical protein n=1 Tax=Polynucleobacter sp. MWH-CaK5 TaxID=2689107 RepID=UPI001BFD9215|nr:hypothetical protein [Polynucleobacter sp. MWH-CaK5]QWD89168.1 hypothetical protein GQ367_01435 [Polynucleobacter sp. MWH-CaK5]
MLKNFFWGRVNNHYTNYLAPIVFLPYCLDVLLHVFFDATSIFKSIHGAFAVSILIAIALYFFMKKNWHIKFDVVSIWIILMMCQVALSTIWSFQNVGWFNIVLFVCLTLIYLKRPSLVEIDFAVQIFMSLMGLSILLSLIFSINEWGWTQHNIRHPWVRLLGFEIKRLAGLFPGPGMLGMTSAILLIYSAVNVQKSTLCAISLFGLLLADSKAAFVAIFCSALLLIFCMRGDNHRHKNRLILIVVGVIMYMIAIPASLSLESNEHRLSIWGLSFLGGGLTSGSHQGEWGVASHHHNFILDAIYRDGFLLTAIYTLIFLVMLVFLKQATNKRNYLFLSLLMPVVVYSMFDLGIIWGKLNIATMTLILAMLGESSDD